MPPPNFIRETLWGLFDGELFYNDLLVRRNVPRKLCDSPSIGNPELACQLVPGRELEAYLVGGISDKFLVVRNRDDSALV